MTKSETLPPGAIVVTYCSKNKATTTSLPRDLYQGDRVRTVVGFADSFGVPVWFVSGKYGLLDPTVPVEPYDYKLSAETPHYDELLKSVRAEFGRLVDEERLRGIMLFVDGDDKGAEPYTTLIIRAAMQVGVGVAVYDWKWSLADDARTS